MRPSSTAATMVAKLSSRSVIAGRFLADVGAGDAHRDADVGLLERRRVVHAVAGHRDDVAALLPCRRRRAACRPATRARRRRCPRPGVRALVAHRLELAAGDDARVLREVRARWRSVCAVSGWSPVIITGVMPARVARLHGRRALRAAADPSSRPGRAASSRARRRQSVAPVFRAIASTRKPLGRHPLLGVAATRARPHRRAARSRRRSAMRVQTARTVGRALRIRDRPCRRLVQRRHAPALGAEGISSVRGCSAIEHARRRVPALGAATTSAPSVGSPSIVHRALALHAAGRRTPAPRRASSSAQPVRRIDRATPSRGTRRPDRSRRR